MPKGKPAASRRQIEDPFDTPAEWTPEPAAVPKRGGTARGRSTRGGAARGRSTRGGTTRSGTARNTAKEDPESEPESDGENFDEEAKKDDAEDDIEVGAADDDADEDDDEDIYDDFVPTGDGLTGDASKHKYEYIYVPEDERVTTDNLGQYAAAGIISIRTQQIAKTGLSTVEKDDCDTNEDIAKKELMEGKSPIMVRRIVGVRTEGDRRIVVYELWRPNEMLLPQL